jgi:hypothetical protein
MSKLDIGVGDEFPLDEGGDDRRSARRDGRHGHCHVHHRHMRGGHYHHRGSGLARFAFVLVVACVVALIVGHKLPTEAAYGMIALGLAVIAIMITRHWRHHRRMTQQVS